MRKSIFIRVLAAVILITVVAVGCRKKSSDVEVRQYYEVNFDEQGRTSAKATFTVGSDNRPVVFSSISQVKANSIIRNGVAQTSPGGFSWELDSAREVVFTFRKNDNSILTNSISRSLVEGIQITGDTVFSVDDTIRVSWTGDAAEEYKYFAFSLNRIYDGSGLESSTAAEVENGLEYAFDFAETSHFHPGVYQLKMYATKKLPLQQSDGFAGGQMDVSRQISKFIYLQ